MITRRYNVVMRESNDNIDHKNVVTTWISFADEVKYFSLYFSFAMKMPGIVP